MKHQKLHLFDHFSFCLKRKQITKFVKIKTKKEKKMLSKFALKRNPFGLAKTGARCFSAAQHQHEMTETSKYYAAIDTKYVT